MHHVDPMLIFGIVFLLAGGVGVFFLRRFRDQLHAMIGTETWAIEELEQQKRAAQEVVGEGEFRQQAEVVGVAHPRPEGLIVSEGSGTECVWFHYQVEIEFREEYWDNEGRRKTRKRTETVHDNVSHEGYALRDDNGQLIGIDPNGAPPDRPEQTLDRFDPREREQPEVFGVKLPKFLDSSNIIGHHHKEWVIRPEQRLYVLGEAHDKIGPLVMAKPPQGHFIISTRSEQELRRDRERKHWWLRLGTIAALVAGPVLIVVGLVR
jgi:hypothetical protein